MPLIINIIMSITTNNNNNNIHHSRTTFASSVAHSPRDTVVVNTTPHGREHSHSLRQRSSSQQRLNPLP